MKRVLPYIIIACIVCIFFYKTILYGMIPFPGDLLLSSYAPWRHVSYMGYVAGAVPSKDQYFDVIRELYPWKTEVIAQIRQYSIPLWNPYNFSGAPLLANYQSQVLYPLGIIYFALPQDIAWTILVMLQPMLGMIWTYLFATVIGISPYGAMLAAIAFNFSGFANVWIEFNTVWHTVLWLPLLLYLLEKGIANRKLRFFQQMLFILALFSSITGGHPQDFITMFVFFLMYGVIRIGILSSWTFKEKVSFFLFPLLPIITIPFLLAAAQILPTVDLFQNSARVPHDYQYILQHMLIQPWQLGIIAVQEFFGNPATRTNFLANTYVGKAISIGTAGFFLSMVTFCFPKKTWHMKFFIISSAALLLYTVNTPIAALLQRYPIPLLSTGTPTRLLFLFCFCLSILAGFGVDILSKNKKIPWKAIIITSLVMAFLWFFALFHPAMPELTYTASSYNTMKKAMLFSSGFIALSFFLIFFLRSHKKIFFYGFIGLVGIELFYGFLKFNPFVPRNFIFPNNPLITFFQERAGIDRIWGYGTAQIEANFATQYRLFSPDGTDPLNLKWYNAFLQSSKDGNIAKTFTKTTRSDALVAPGYGAKDLPNNPYRLRILDTVGVKYIIDRTENPKDDQTFTKDRFKEIWHKEDWTVYENIKAVPRFFLTSKYIPYETDEEFETVFFSDTFLPDSSILVLKKDAEAIGQLEKGNGSVELLSYNPEKVELAVKTNTKQLLYLSDTFDAGWKAYVDEKLTDLYKANYTFRAVVVPAGDHNITFSYQPESFAWGMRFTLLGSCMLGILCVWRFIIFLHAHYKSDQKNKCTSAC